MLFIDEAHDLRHVTLVRLKRLVEAVTDSGGHERVRQFLRGPLDQTQISQDARGSPVQDRSRRVRVRMSQRA